MSEDELNGTPYVEGDEAGPLVGDFCYDAQQDRWTWSTEVFTIHGFEPRDVVPTTELIRFHAHPEDRDAVTGTLAGAMESAGPFRLTFRLVDAQGSTRRVLMLGSGSAGDPGDPRLCGQLVDLTPLQDEIINEDLSPLVDDFRAHRAVIEQAKGIVIQLFAVDADEAFDRLRACSQSANVKLRDIAQYLVAAAAQDRTPGKTTSRKDQTSLDLSGVLEALLLATTESG